MDEKITYRQMMAALQQSTDHWIRNCNEAGLPETELTLAWFYNNCGGRDCALCKIFSLGAGKCGKCPLNDWLDKCCKEWNRAFKNVDFHNLLAVEARLRSELKKRRGIRGLWYRAKWRLT